MSGKCVYCGRYYQDGWLSHGLHFCSEACINQWEAEERRKERAIRAQEDLIDAQNQAAYEARIQHEEQMKLGERELEIKEQESRDRAIQAAREEENRHAEALEQNEILRAQAQSEEYDRRAAKDMAEFRTYYQSSVVPSSDSRIIQNFHANWSSNRQMNLLSDETYQIFNKKSRRVLEIGNYEGYKPGELSPHDVTFVKLFFTNDADDIEKVPESDITEETGTSSNWTLTRDTDTYHRIPSSDEIAENLWQAAPHADSWDTIFRAYGNSSEKIIFFKDKTFQHLIGADGKEYVDQCGGWQGDFVTQKALCYRAHYARSSESAPWLLLEDNQPFLFWISNDACSSSQFSNLPQILTPEQKKGCGQFNAVPFTLADNEVEQWFRLPETDKTAQSNLVFFTDGKSYQRVLVDGDKKVVADFGTWTGSFDTEVVLKKEYLPKTPGGDVFEKQTTPKTVTFRACREGLRSPKDALYKKVVTPKEKKKRREIQEDLGITDFDPLEMMPTKYSAGSAYYIEGSGSTSEQYILSTYDSENDQNFWQYIVMDEGIPVVRAVGRGILARNRDQSSDYTCGTIAGCFKKEAKLFSVERLGKVETVYVAPDPFTSTTPVIGQYRLPESDSCWETVYYLHDDCRYHKTSNQGGIHVTEVGTWSIFNSRINFTRDKKQHKVLGYKPCCESFFLTICPEGLKGKYLYETVKDISRIRIG